jgi:hypothetical protein
MKSITRQGINNTSAKNINRITVTKYKGVLSGAIIGPTPPTCIISLDFECEDNSQYIPVV